LFPCRWEQKLPAANQKKNMFPWKTLKPLSIHTQNPKVRNLLHLYFSKDSCYKFPKWFADLQATLMLETCNQETIGLLNVQKQITNMRKNKRLLDYMKSRKSWSSCLLMCLSFLFTSYFTSRYMDRVGWNPKLLMVSYTYGHIRGRESTSPAPLW
jgi:hypothetical protein